MQKPANLPKTEGVYIVLHDGLKVAYVGNCKNIRHRAAIWEYNFRKQAKDPDHPMPVHGFPKDTNEADWQFGGMPGYSVDVVRQALQANGYKILNDKTRSRDLLEWNGKVATLAEHARDTKVPYTKAYYRWKAGKSLDEVFGD